MLRGREKTADQRESARHDEFESVLAACLDAHAQHGEAAVDEACARYPQLAERLRARVDSLARLGLLTPREEPRQFGRYELVRKLGEGGMGVVYLARDPRTRREVALKVSHFALGPGDRARARFEREIKAFGQLAHACVVPVIDVGEFEGRAYFTMEYVEGATLSSVIEELQREHLAFDALTTEHVRRIVGADTPLDALDTWGRTYVETVCRIVLDLASALAHAHEHGIVHRDVKPSNVIVRRDGRALIFDLGLAHLADQPSLTRSGDFAGTPYYVSPEQIAARPGELDRRTDVYSLGVTLYELLALRRPFEGPTSARVLRHIQTAEPLSLRKLNPSVPRDLETICATAMEKAPARRYPSMAELADDLRAFLAFKPVRAKPVGAWRRVARRARGNPLLAATCALALLVILGVPIGLLWANAAIREQRDRATQAANDAREQALLSSAQNHFLVQLFELAQADARDAASAIEMLDRGVERLRQRNDLEPLVRAALLETAARSYVELDRDDRALPLFDRAFAIRHRELGEQHVDTAVLLLELASVHLRQRNHGSALALAQRSLAAFESCGGAAGVDAARCHRVLAEASLEARELALAESHLHEAQRVLNTLTDVGAELALVNERFGDLARERGLHDAAAERYAYALASYRAQWSPDAKAIARTLERLAALDESRGRAGAAQRWRAEADELRRASGADVAAAASVPAAQPGEFVLEFAPPWRAAFDQSFQAGITALQSGAHREAITHFERCRASSPRHAVSAYNIACGHALLGEVDVALEWLTRAVDGGFAYSDERFEIACKDADLDRVRDDPRSAAIFARMRLQRAAAHDYAAQAARHVPSIEPPERGWPVLVVLHDSGATKDTLVRSGPWRRVADALGAILLAPSGSLPTGAAPEEGMAWVEDLAGFASAPASAELAIRAALDKLGADVRIDPRRVLIVGEGQAAPLAFDLAIRAPGTFAGVVLHNGPPHVAVPADELRTAASIGLAVSVVIGAGAQVPGARDVDTRELVADVAGWLEARGFRGSSVVELAADASVAERLTELARALLR